MTFAELKPLIDGVKYMLHAWVIDGHNSFIHPRLYEEGLPICLQDAFTTLAPYEARTPAVTDTIMQIAENRSASLALQHLAPAMDREGILHQLALVQALFVYEFVQLWDGHIRARAHAERAIPTLRRWVTTLWQSVKEYRAHDMMLVTPSNPGSPCQFASDFTTRSNLWRLWILTESIRRTDILITTVLTTYEVMTKGSAECSGINMFTARAGLWQAKSALQWCQLIEEKSPLLVPSFEPAQLMEKERAEECDEFVKLFWGFLVGQERVQRWCEKGPQPREVILTA